MTTNILIIRLRNIFFREKLCISLESLSKFNCICVLTNLSDDNNLLIEKKIRKLCPIKCTFHNSFQGRKQLPYSTVFRMEILPKLSPAAATFIGTNITDYYFYLNSLLYCSRKLRSTILYYNLKNWPNGSAERKRPIATYIKDSNRLNCIPNWIKKKSYKIYSLSDKLAIDFVKSLGKNIKRLKNDLDCITIKIENSIIYIGNFLKKPIITKCDVQMTLNSEDDFETCMRYYQLREDVSYSKRDIEHFYVGVISELKVVDYMTFFPPRLNKLEKLFMMELF